MDVLVVDDLVVEIVELEIEQLHNGRGRIFNVERDLRVADLAEVGLLTAHLERFRQKLDSPGDVALGHVADDLAADLDIALVELTDLDLHAAHRGRFHADIARGDAVRQKNVIAHGLLARIGDGGKVAHKADLARIKAVGEPARELELQIDGDILVPAHTHKALVGKRRILVQKLHGHAVHVDGDLVVVAHVKPHH